MSAGGVAPPVGDSPEVGGQTPREGWYQRLRQQAKALKRQIVVLYYATQDQEIGWVPKSLILLAVGYAVSPIDLIPDFIPVLGLIDDLLILPGLIWLAIRWIPEPVMLRARRRAEEEPLTLHKNWGFAAFFMLMWDAAAVLLVWLICTKTHWSPWPWQPTALAVFGVLVVVEAAWLGFEVWKEGKKKEEGDKAPYAPLPDVEVGVAAPAAADDQM